MVIDVKNNYNYSIANQSYQKKDLKTQEVSNPSASTLPIAQTSENRGLSGSVAFSGLFSSKDEIKDPEKNKKYNEIKNTADPETKRKLKNLLKSGRLLDENSDDKSSTLDNLHKIATIQRYEGLDNATILRETVKEIENPFIITQKFGDIPQETVESIVNYEKQLQEKKDSTPGLTADPKDFNVEYSSTCPAASMQFNIADKKPAEYARIAADLTSPEGQFIKKVKYTNISPSMSDSLELLKDFNINAKKPANNWEDLDVIVKPDANAMIRAQIQNKHQDPDERSSVGVLMQSAFMTLGSQNAYNSLTDKRYGKFSTNNEGLTEFEKNFLESIMDNEPKVSIVYQNIDENEKLQNYNFDFKETESHLLESLKSGSNIIIGIIEFDENKKVLGGHEITVIGSKRDAKGNLNFICNDTDDNYSGAVVISSQDLIPKIHHAGIPAKLVDIPKQPDIGYQILADYNNYKQFEETQVGQNLSLAI
jgi:hypothetical protein